MSCIDKHESACPFSLTDASDYVQNFGCLPTPHDIRIMRVVHSKTWACHEQPTKPCVGAIRDLKRNGLPHNVIDTELLTEKSDWYRFVNEIGHATSSAHSQTDL